jgi:3-hydroxyisobutyrate dehydrogenase-like beta-hydroxyacid dehydrogenase
MPKMWVSLATRQADQHLSLPCLEFVHQQYQSIMENGLGSRDSSILFDRLKGLKQR